MPLTSIRDASAVVEMVCSCRANLVRGQWFAEASTSSFCVQGSPRWQAAVCRGICFSIFCLLIPPQLLKWSTSHPICCLLSPPLPRWKPYTPLIESRSHFFFFGGQGHPGRARGTQGKARGPPLKGPPSFFLCFSLFFFVLGPHPPLFLRSPQ